MSAICNTDKLTFIEYYYVPDTMLNAICELSHLLFTLTLWDRNDYYFSIQYEKTEAKKGHVNSFKGTQLERDRDGFPTLASETEFITSTYMYTYQIFALELGNQILAQGKFKFTRGQTSKVQRSICMTKYSKGDIHSWDKFRPLKVLF